MLNQALCLPSHWRQSWTLLEHRGAGGLRDTQLPLGWSQGKEKKSRSPESIHLMRHREDTRLWLCSWEDTSMPGLSQGSPKDLKTRAPWLCRQQPYRELGDAVLCCTRQACPPEPKHAGMGYCSSANKYSSYKGHQLVTNGIMSHKSNNL